MDFRLATSASVSLTNTCLAIGIFQDHALTDAANLLDKDDQQLIQHLIKQQEFTGELGKTLILHALPHRPTTRLLLVGCGKAEEFSTLAYQKALQKMVTAIYATQADNMVCYLPSVTTADNQTVAWKIQQAVTAFITGSYQFDTLKSKKADPIALKQVTFPVNSAQDEAAGMHAIAIGQAIAHGINFAKELGNLPANICTPSYLAEQAVKFSQQHAKVKTTLLEESDMQTLGMGSLLSVSQGSEQPAKLIVMQYQNAKSDSKPIVLVGKGVTFDTGGISLKPSNAMDEMKFDMCGAASVFGVLLATMELNLPINLIGIVPATENMPNGKATKPGDVVTSLSGQTIEILNTDAEGRLILCDALTYSERFDPEVVIDIATLTGAMVVALGRHASGLMSNHDQLAEALLSAGTQSGDRAWRFPIWEDYQEHLNSNFADMANIGDQAPAAGSITAACFLARFTKNLHWAHLDIAGTAWKGGKEKGATGRPVPLLMQYLLNRCQH